MKESGANGLLVGKTDKDGGDGIIIKTPEGEIKAGGGEIIINEISSNKHCEELSEINQDGGGVAIPCDEQPTANKGPFMDGGKITELESEISRLKNDYYRLIQSKGDKTVISRLKKQIVKLEEKQKTNQMKNSFNRINKFLDRFPYNAVSWGQATDEVRDMARVAREYYNEMTLDVLNDDPKALQPLNFKELKTPSQWNTKGKQFIFETYNKMNEQTQKQYLEWFDAQFLDNAESGAKIPNMKKEFYYLKTGNLLKDRFGKYARITKHSKDGVSVVEHSEFPISTAESEIAFDHLILMMDGGLATIEDCPYNKDDRAHSFLLRQEIAIIQLLGDVAEYGTKVSRLEKDHEDFKGKADATIKGMEVMSGGGTIDKKVNALKPGDSVTITKIGDTRVFVERTGDGKKIRFVREDKSGFETISEQPFNAVILKKKAEKGAKIKNQYKGRDATEIWDEWSQGQRRHFLSDHAEKIGIPQSSADNFSTYTWAQLKREVKQEIQEPLLLELMLHVGEGQYDKGGKTPTSLVKKILKKDKFWHARLLSPKGAVACATPDWAKTIAQGVAPGAKVTTCKMGEDWHAQKILIPAAGIKKLEAKELANKIAQKFKKA